MIKENVDYFSVKMMCRLLSVSPSGYYSWRDRPLSPRAQKNVLLADKIKPIFDEEKSRAGAKRIAKRLKQKDILVASPCCKNHAKKWLASESSKKIQSNNKQ